MEFMESEHKHAGGRPPIWSDPNELETMVEDYFLSTNRPTLSGLALFLGIERKTLYNYEDRDEFLHIIKKARHQVESIYEERAIYEDRPTGVIFALKNMGWSDNQKVDHTTDGKEINVTIIENVNPDRRK
jgi:hypothetical protein